MLESNQQWDRDFEILRENIELCPYMCVSKRSKVRAGGNAFSITIYLNLLDAFPKCLNLNFLYKMFSVILFFKFLKKLVPLGMDD